MAYISVLEALTSTDVRLAIRQCLFEFTATVEDVLEGLARARDGIALVGLLMDSITDGSFLLPCHFFCSIHCLQVDVMKFHQLDMVRDDS